MLKIIIALTLFCAGPALAAPGIAVEATPSTKSFAELSIVGLMTQSQLEIYDAVQLKPQVRPQFTAVFDRVGPLLRIRVLDEKTRTILSQFEIQDSTQNATLLRRQSRTVATRVIDATRGYLAAN